MTHKEIEVEVDRILFKKARGEQLTKREDLILAYGYYAAGCSSCYATVWVGPYKSRTR